MGRGVFGIAATEVGPQLQRIDAHGTIVRKQFLTHFGLAISPDHSIVSWLDNRGRPHDLEGRGSREFTLPRVPRGDEVGAVSGAQDLQGAGPRGRRLHDLRERRPQPRGLRLDLPRHRRPDRPDAPRDRRQPAGPRDRARLDGPRRPRRPAGASSGPAGTAPGRPAATASTRSPTTAAACWASTARPGGTASTASRSSATTAASPARTRSAPAHSAA